MRQLFVYCLCFLLSLCCSLRANDEKTAVVVCENGLEMFQWDLDFIKEAKQSIEILACFFGGDIACELLTHVKARLAEVSELQVYILASPILIRDKEWKMIKQLKKNYPDNFHLALSTQVVKLLPDMTSIDNHVKMFVVDEKYFSAGGTNLEESHCSDGSFTPKKSPDRNHELANHLPAGMRDQDLVGRGPVAKKLRKAFHQLYSLWEHYNATYLLEKDVEKFKNCSHYFPVTEKACVERFDTSDRSHDLLPNEINVFVGGPHQQENVITNEYVRLIKEAKEEIVIENLYFFPVDAIFDALMEAVNRGVKLTVITNGLSDISPEGAKLFCWANRLSYVPVFYGATFHFWDAPSVRESVPYETQIYEYHVEDVLLHKKMMIVDNRILIVGSYNLGFKSAYGDYELVLVMDSKKVVDDVLKVHVKDLQNSRKITPEKACDWYFDPVTSYLGGLQRKYHGFL